MHTRILHDQSLPSRPFSHKLVRCFITIYHSLKANWNPKWNLPLLDIPNDQIAVILTAKANQELLIGRESQRFNANSMQFMTAFFRFRIPIPNNYIRSEAHVTDLTGRDKWATEMRSMESYGERVVIFWSTKQSNIPWRHVNGRYRVRVAAQKLLSIVLHIHEGDSRAQWKYQMRFIRMHFQAAGDFAIEPENCRRLQLLNFDVFDDQIHFVDWNGELDFSKYWPSLFFIYRTNRYFSIDSEQRY